MKKIVLVLLVALLLAGCGLYSASNPINNQTQKATSDFSKDVVDSISYVYDARVDVCYAVIRSRTYTGYQVYSIAAVPFEKIRGRVDYTTIGGR